MASTNPTPNQVFVANSVPSGGFFAKFYRPSVSAGNVVTWTALTPAFYRIMSFSPNREGVVKDRPDVDDGDNGWTLALGKLEGGITVQLPTDSSPTLQPGDAFSTSVIFRDAAGAAITQMVVITGLSVNVDANARQQSGNARVNLQATAGGTGYNDLGGVPEYAA